MLGGFGGMGSRMEDGRMADDGWAMPGAMTLVKCLGAFGDN